MVRTYFDFSIFLDDGSAFGKANIDIDVLFIPKISEEVNFSNLDFFYSDNKNKTLVKFVVEYIEVCDRDSNIKYNCYIEDVVIESREIAIKFIKTLSNLGFDCDIW